MNNLSTAFFISILFFVSACGNHHQPPPASPVSATDSTTDSSGKHFFPIADFLRSEIGYVDSTPLAILQYNIQGTHKDSSFIQHTDFHYIATNFLQSDLENEALEKNFTETSFFDKTSGYLTFTYAASGDTSPLRRVDVQALPTGDNATQVKSIYMERVFKKADTGVTQKMYWQSKHNFVIITSLTPPGKPPVVTQTKVVWDPGSEE